MTLIFFPPCASRYVSEIEKNLAEACKHVQILEGDVKEKIAEVRFIVSSPLYTKTIVFVLGIKL